MKNEILAVYQAQQELNALVNERAILNRKIELAEQRLREVNRALAQVLPDDQIYFDSENNLIAQKVDCQFITVSLVVPASESVEIKGF